MASVEFWSVIRSLLRRRWVIVPALVVAVAAGAAAYLGTPQSYTSSATMVLTTTEYGGTESQNPADPTDLTNPMLNFSDSLRTTSAILISAMGTDEVREQLGVTGSDSQLTVNDGRTNPDLLGVNGPFLYISATSGSAGEARRIVVDAQQLIREKLAVWQQQLGAPAKTFVGLVDVVPPSAPAAGSRRAIKLGVLAFLGGFAVCLGIAYCVLRVRARRPARTSAESAGADGSAPPAEPAEPVLSPEQAPQSRPVPEPILVTEQPADFHPPRNAMLKPRTRSRKR